MSKATIAEKPAVPQPQLPNPVLKTPDDEQKPAAKNGTPAPKFEIKAVRHSFTQDERNQFGGDLARTIGGLRGIEAEFDQVKASYKAKTTEAEARIDKLSTDLVNGFEMRQKRCFVIFNPKLKRKSFWLEGADASKDEPVLTEEMTREDFQADLIQAESKFNHRCEIEICPRAGSDFGLLIVGEYGGSWFAALRVSVGAQKLEERLDSEQPSAKKRFDIIKRAADRFTTWTVERLGKEAAKGFKDPLEKAVQSQKERAE